MNERLNELEIKVADLSSRLAYINAADLTAITRGMPYKPNFTKEYISLLRAGGVTAIHAALTIWFYDNWPASFKRMAQTLRFIDENADDLLLVRTAEDISRASQEGKIGIIIHFHNSVPIDDDLSLVAAYHRLGLRVMQLTYQGRSLLADGCGERAAGGVSSFGTRVIEEMNRVGIVVDVAHAGPQSISDAIDISSKPILFSHGGMSAVRNHARNLSDELATKLAKKGGVIGMMAKSETVVKDGAINGATLDDYLAHIDYAVKLVGADHVAIGLENGHGVDDGDLRGLEADFMLRLDKPHERGLVPKTYDFDKFYSAQGVNDARLAKANIIRGLLKRNYSEADVAKILASNLVRVYQQTMRA
jgi:membrane dipeptidase